MPPIIRLNFDLTKSNWSRFGISWFTKQLFFMNQGPTPDHLDKTLSEWYAEAVNVLRESIVLSGLDLNNEAQLTEANNRIEKSIEEIDRSPEHYAMLVYQCIPEVRDAIKHNDAQRTASYLAAVASARSMLIFLQLFEETVWRGHTVAQLEQTLNIWTENQKDHDENFWQSQLSANAYLLSQIFSFPVVILKEKAFLGGKSVDNTGGNIADFLLKNNLSQNTVLVEIKTPETKLLGKKYRQVYSVSQELSGAIIQISNYKDSLLKDYDHLIAEWPDLVYQAFNPRCLVIAGTLSEEITDRTRRKSFELFRSGLGNVQVITYDELFEKIKILLDLFKNRK